MTTHAVYPQIAYCPECRCSIRFHLPPRRGQLVTCAECGEISEVVSVAPIQLYWANTEGDGEESRRYQDDSRGRRAW